MKKHILFVLDYYLPHRGGVETVFEQVFLRLIKKWYKITLLTSRFDQKLAKYESAHWMSIYRVGCGRLSFMISAFFKGIALLYKHKDISVIHASTYGGALPASVLWKLFGKKVVLTVHEVFGKLWLFYKGWFSGRGYLLFEKLIFLFPYNVYHCVSRYTMNSLRLLYGIADNKLQVIYNGVDNDFWSSDAVSQDILHLWKKQHDWNGKYVVLYYGHAGKSKWLDTLIECVPLMIKKDPNILFVFNIIESKRRIEILHRLHALEKTWFAHQIQIFEGMERQDLRTMVAACDVVVAPSFSEWFGSVHTEAVAMNKPLITTFVASIPEVVSGKVIFVRPGVSWDILQWIISFQQNQQVWEDLPAKKFDWDVTVDSIEALY